MQVSLKTIKYFLDALHYHILILDVSFRPVVTNLSFTRMFGISPEAIKGDFITRTDCVPSLQKILTRNVASGYVVDGAETLCSLPTGQRIFLLVNAQRICSLDLPKMILVELKNIIKKREAEHRIQKFNAVEAFVKHAKHFVELLNKDYVFSIKSICPYAMKCLRDAYDWSIYIRVHSKMMVMAAVLAEMGMIFMAHLPNRIFKKTNSAIGLVDCDEFGLPGSYNAPLAL